MQKNSRKTVLKIAITLLSIALVSLTLSLILNFYFHIQYQSCVNSPNCHQEQYQAP